ncbi:LysM peptidoglycan-binding domain-containing protein [Streptomyces sp. BI20]|uniref:LysM peptidoglycan-binding domain-containing protein n=1 Tax=Streptomyces sp. BI20 TaxID=3403460 RepID=UPI003C77294F
MRSGNGRHRRPRQVPAIVVTAGVAGSALALPLLASGSAGAATGSAWDKVAECESGGTWSATQGGGLGLTAEEWKAGGGQEYAPTPDLASRQQQQAVAEKLLAARGQDSFGACAAGVDLTTGSSGGQGSGSGHGPGTSVPQGGGAEHEAPVPALGVAPHDSRSSYLPPLDETPAPFDSGDGAILPGVPLSPLDPAVPALPVPVVPEPVKPVTPTTPTTPTTPGTPGTPGTTDPTAPTDPTTGTPTTPTTPGTPGTVAPTDPTNPGDPTLPVSPTPTTPGTPGTVAPTTPGTSSPDASGSPSPQGTPGAVAETPSGGGKHRGPAAVESGTPASTGTDAPSAKTYTVKEGDTLSEIARAQGGKAGWNGLYEENKQVIGEDADLIKPGQNLELGLR